MAEEELVIGRKIVRTAGEVSAECGKYPGFGELTKVRVDESSFKGRPKQVNSFLHEHFVFCPENCDPVKRGKIPKFVFPFKLEGSVWVNVDSFGRFGAEVGPMQSQWDLSETVAQATGR